MGYSLLSLWEIAKACLQTGDAEAWHEFLRRTQPVLSAAVRRACRRYGLDPFECADDLVQEVYLKLTTNRGELLKNLVLLDSEAILAYLRVVSVNLVADLYHAQHAARRSITRTVALDSPDGDRGLADQSATDIEKRLLLGQVETLLLRHLRGPSAMRDRCVFWLYYRQGLTTKAISGLPAIGLSEKGVVSLLSRLTRTLRAEIQAGVGLRAAGGGFLSGKPLNKEKGA